jgi:uncharacterized protein
MSYLFSGDPKNDRNFLFGRHKVIEQFEKSISDENRLIIITGLRKTGKTSLIQSILADKMDYVIYIDLRDTGDMENIDREKTLNFFRIAINRFLEKNQSFAGEIKHYLKMIRGINIQGVGIEFDHNSQSQIDLTEIFQKLNEWAKLRTRSLLLVIDEAQYLKKSTSFDMSAILAGIFDKYRNLKIILTGSEMDLLFKFLGDEDPEASLNGKPRIEIELNPLNEDLCIQFLNRGLQERGFTINQSNVAVIEYAAKSLGSRIGWLNEFGLKCVEQQNILKTFVDDIIEKRAASSKKEFEKFLDGKKKKNYRDIIEYLANLDSQFNFTKYFVDRPSTNLCVENLRRAGFIKNFQGLYSINDHVLEYSFSMPDFDFKRSEIIKTAKLELRELKSKP